MKRFLKFIGISCLFLIVILIGIRLLWINHTVRAYPVNVIPGDVHTIVIGASNGECAWNDSILPGTRNLCYSGYTHAAIYNSLRWAVEYNDAPVDTVLFCINVPSLIYFEDSIIGESTWVHKEEQVSFLDYPAFFSIYREFPDYWKLITNLDFLWAPERTTPGGEFRFLNRDKLNDPHSYDAVRSALSRIGGKDGFSEDYIRSHCTIQVAFFRKVIRYCRDKQLNLHILCTPLHNVPDMIGNKGFYDFLSAELDKSSMIADYSRFPLPDSTYFGDLEHLNHRGARYFSEHIAKNGLKLNPIHPME